MINYPFVAFVMTLIIQPITVRANIARYVLIDLVSALRMALLVHGPFLVLPVIFVVLRPMSISSAQQNFFVVLVGSWAINLIGVVYLELNIFFGNQNILPE